MSLNNMNVSSIQKFKENIEKMGHFETNFEVVKLKMSAINLNIFVLREWKIHKENRGLCRSVTLGQT